jgi:hypothetical protein
LVNATCTGAGVDQTRRIGAGMQVIGGSDGAPVARSAMLAQIEQGLFDAG